MLDKFYWIANCLDPRFGYDSFENENYIITLKRALLIVFELDSAKDVQQQEVSASQDDEQNPKRRKRLFPPRRYSDEPQTLLFRDDRIEMELAMFKAEARGMKGIIELDPVRWWIRNSSKMPLMSKLAMIYLLPPASTADVERLFNVAGRKCRPYRSRLNPQTIDLFVTLKHRMLSKKRSVEDAKNNSSSEDGKNLL